jgi:hypothetical protein
MSLAGDSHARRDCPRTAKGKPPGRARQGHRNGTARRILLPGATNPCTGSIDAPLESVPSDYITQCGGRGRARKTVDGYLSRRGRPIPQHSSTEDVLAGLPPPLGRTVPSVGRLSLAQRRSGLAGWGRVFSTARISRSRWSYAGCRLGLFALGHADLDLAESRLVVRRSTATATASIRRTPRPIGSVNWILGLFGWCSEAVRSAGEASSIRHPRSKAR